MACWQIVPIAMGSAADCLFVSRELHVLITNLVTVSLQCSSCFDAWLTLCCMNLHARQLILGAAHVVGMHPESYTVHGLASCDLVRQPQQAAATVLKMLLSLLPCHAGDAGLLTSAREFQASLQIWQVH